MNARARGRRIAAAALALVLAFLLFRTQLAAAVVTRGDDALRSGDADGALRFYARALLIDRSSTIAADRLAFRLSLRHDPVYAHKAIALASAALAQGPATPSLLADRAFAELQLQAWAAAERDFVRAGDIGRDARYEQFAARMALRRNDKRSARADALRALTWDPTFSPARALLRSLR